MTLQVPPDTFNAAAFASESLDSSDFARLNIEAHPLAYEVQDLLAELLDMDDIFVKGGAVRNTISGHEVDEIDVIFDVTQSARVDPDYQEPEEMLRTIAMAIKLSGDFDGCIIPEVIYVDDEPILNMKGTYQGMEIDMSIVTHPVDKYTLIQECEPPILTSIMDPDGNCWAAHDFNEHLEAGIIVTNNPYFQEKFQKPGNKCEKYGWRCMNSHDAAQYLADRRTRNQQPYDI